MMADKSKRKPVKSDFFYGKKPAPPEEEQEEEETEIPAVETEASEGADTDESEVKMRSEIEAVKEPARQTTVEKEKALFYLPAQLIHKLERIWVETRGLTGKKVSKSAIVSAALEEALEEFDKKREDSKLIKHLDSFFAPRGN